MFWFDQRVLSSKLKESRTCVTCMLSSNSSKKVVSLWVYQTVSVKRSAVGLKIESRKAIFSVY